jgi:hypothetical protein
LKHVLRMLKNPFYSRFMLSSFITAFNFCSTLMFFPEFPFHHVRRRGRHACDHS